MATTGPLIVSVSGVRGVVGDGLTPQVALAFASAFASHLNRGPVVVSRDGRPSGTMLRYEVQAGLVAGGCDIHDLGVSATPTVGLVVRSLHAPGGVQITASHNPAPYNGLKLFGPDGRVLQASVGAEVKRLFEAGATRNVKWDELGTVRRPGNHRTRISGRQLRGRTHPGRYARAGAQRLRRLGPAAAPGPR